MSAVAFTFYNFSFIFFQGVQGDYIHIHDKHTTLVIKILKIAQQTDGMRALIIGQCHTFTPLQLPLHTFSHSHPHTHSFKFHSFNSFLSINYHSPAFSAVTSHLLLLSLTAISALDRSVARLGLVVRAQHGVL